MRDKRYSLHDVSRDCLQRRMTPEHLILV